MSPRWPDPWEAEVVTDLGLSGRTAVVTGGGRGVFRAAALQLAAAGADVVVNYVAHQEAADRLVAELKTHGVAALAIRADVSREAEVRGMFEEMLAALRA